MRQIVANVDWHLLISSLGRLMMISSAAFGLATIANWAKYQNYWHSPIFSIPAGEETLLLPMLPGKLSYALSQGDFSKLQKTLENHESLFSIVVTNCKNTQKNCPTQQILYASIADQAGQKLTLADLENQPYDLLIAPFKKGLEKRAFSFDNRTVFQWEPAALGKVMGRVYYIRKVPPTFVKDYLHWLLNPLQFQGVPMIYSLTTALFLTGGFAAWVMVESLLFVKRIQLKQITSEREKLKRDAHRLKHQLEDNIQQIPLIIFQREQAIVQLENYHQEQAQQTQHLEQAIQLYEQQLKEKESRLQQSGEQLEYLQNELAQVIQFQTEVQEQIQSREKAIAKLQKKMNALAQEKLGNVQFLQQLRQELQTTQHREQQARQRIEKLNKTIQSLTQERNQSDQQCRELETHLAQLPDIDNLMGALEAARTELERVRERSKEAEEYAFEEACRLEEKACRLETENRQLFKDLQSAQDYIRQLRYTIEKSKEIALDEENHLEEKLDSQIDLNLLIFSPEAREALSTLYQSDYKRYQRVIKALEHMSINLRYGSLHTHKYEALCGPHGEEIFESYVENKTPNAWRIFWYYGPGSRFLTIHAITPHP
jgi:hypothetical protein